MSKVQTLNPSTPRRRHPPPDLTCSTPHFQNGPSPSSPPPSSPHHPSTHCNGTCCEHGHNPAACRGFRGSSPICTICMRVSGLAGPGRHLPVGFSAEQAGPLILAPWPPSMLPGPSHKRVVSRSHRDELKDFAGAPAPVPKNRFRAIGRACARFGSPVFQRQASPERRLSPGLY